MSNLQKQIFVQCLQYFVGSLLAEVQDEKEYNIKMED